MLALPPKLQKTYTSKAQEKSSFSTTQRRLTPPVHIRGVPWTGERQTTVGWSKRAIFSVFGRCVFETFRVVGFSVTVKVKTLRSGTCYSSAYMSQTRDQKRFYNISEVAADWQKPMITQRITRPSTAHANEQLDPRCSSQTYHPNQPH